MSTFGLMSVGTNAMYAAQRQLQTTGNNIANASVEGYTRQSVALTTLPSLYSGSGYIGSGVAVSSNNAERGVSAFMTNVAAQTSSNAATDQSRLDMLNRLQDSFGTAEAGIGYASTQFFNAWSDLARQPGDTSSRQVVLSRADDMASMFRNTSDNLDILQATVRDEVSTGVSSVNAMAKQVAALNRQIAGDQGVGGVPSELLDQRDQLIGKISEQVQVTRLEQSDGSLSLMIGGGQSLVLGGSAYEMSAHPDATDPTRMAVSIDVSGVQRSLSAGSLGGGALAGVLTFQNDDLASARTRLNDMASNITTQVNQQQGLGLTPAGTQGAAMFRSAVGNEMPAHAMMLLLSKPEDIAAANPATASTGVANTGTAEVASFSFSAASTLPANQLTLKFTDNSGNYQILDGAGGVQAQGAWVPGQSISHFGFDLQLNGVPKKDDTIGIAKTTDPTANNGNALAMANLADWRDASGATFTDHYASTISDIGVRVQTATSTADISAKAADTAKQRLSSQNGVNLDEEAARLIQYQQSYQAAAKVLQVAQKVFDTLLSLGA